MRFLSLFVSFCHKFMINLCQTDVPGPLQGGQTGQSVKLPNFDFSVVTTIREGVQESPFGGVPPPPQRGSGRFRPKGVRESRPKKGGVGYPPGRGGEVAIWGYPPGTLNSRLLFRNLRSDQIGKFIEMGSVKVMINLSKNYENFR